MAIDKQGKRIIIGMVCRILTLFFFSLSGSVSVHWMMRNIEIEKSPTNVVISFIEFNKCGEKHKTWYYLIDCGVWTITIDVHSKGLDQRIHCTTYIVLDGMWLEYKFIGLFMAMNIQCSMETGWLPYFCSFRVLYLHTNTLYAHFFRQQKYLDFNHFRDIWKVSLGKNDEWL